MGDQLPGLQARLMSQALRKLTANIKRTNTLVIFINQIRMKIGVMFGNPETTTGGNALKFYASVRMDIRRTGAIKKGDEVIGNETKVKVVKNKVAPPFREAHFDILYGEGISREGEIVELGVEHKIVEKSGAWYAYKGEKIGQGKDNAREFLREHADIARRDREQGARSVGVAARASSRRKAAEPGISRAPRRDTVPNGSCGTRAGPASCRMNCARRRSAAGPARAHARRTRPQTG
jgi:recombination protein RecA